MYVLSGPSGSGKTTLAQKLLEDRTIRKGFVKSVSLTTRGRRTGERNGRDYFFVTEEDFLRKRAAKKILEWTKYLGYYYATSREFIDACLGGGRHVLLCLDHRGARKIKRMYAGRAVTVFVAPPSLGVLRERITARCSKTTPEEVAKRLAAAEEEMKSAGWYDYRVLNDLLPVAVKQLKEIILTALRDSRRKG